MIIISCIFALFTYICILGLIMCILDKDVVGCICFITMTIILAYGSIQSYKDYKDYKDETRSTLDINPYKPIKEKTDTIYIKIK